MDHLDKFAQSAWARVQSGYYAPKLERNRPFLSLVSRMKTAEGNPIIAEIKPSSPTCGDLLGGKDIRKLALSYLSGGAVGISVLLDPDHFGGGLENLVLLSDLEIPLLAKDFVVDPIQLEAYAKAGADCALLILPLFERGYPSFALDEMIGFAHQLGLEVVLEVSSAPGLRRALASDADIVGINSRDLATLTLDLRKAVRILVDVSPADPRPILALSGISSPEEVRLLRRAGFFGFLIGTSLLEAKNPEKKLRELISA